MHFGIWGRAADLWDVREGFINVIHVVHFQDPGLRQGCCKPSIRVLGCPLLGVEGQMGLAYQAFADAVAAGDLYTCKQEWLFGAAASNSELV